MKSVICLCALLLLAGCSEPSPVQLTGATMGTSWSVTLTDVGDGDLTALHGQIAAELGQVNAAMSTWDADSEISRFNRMDAGCMTVSAGFAEVMRAALEISRLTGGAYDVSLGPLIDLWGFGAPEGVDPPDDEQIEIVLAQTGYQHLRLSGGQLCKDLDELQINLSSIAKGFGVDLVSRYLQSQGMENFLVEIGGEVMAMGQRYGQNWRIGVENPASERAQTAVLALPLSDRAVATSGDYRNFFVLNDRRYSHIVDARTGQPVANRIASATVVADSVTIADGWATAMMVMDAEKGLALADSLGLAVLLMLRDEEAEVFTSRVNPNWRDEFGVPP